MYKVNTNQTRVPLARLRIAPRAGQSASTFLSQPAHARTVAAAVAAVRAAQLATQALPPPRIVVSAAAKAADPRAPATTTAAGVPRLLPAPVLLPTAYSARFVAAPYLPSSPPGPAGVHGAADAEEEEEEGDQATPRRARRDSGAVRHADVGTPLARRIVGEEMAVPSSGSSGSGTTVSLGIDAMDEQQVRDAVEGRMGVGFGGVLRAAV